MDNIFSRKLKSGIRYLVLGMTVFNLLLATPLALAISAGVSGVIFNDTNQNGVLDAGEVGISGVTVDIAYTDFLTGQPAFSVATTDNNGAYNFAIDVLFPSTTTVTVDTMSVAAMLSVPNALATSSYGVSDSFNDLQGFSTLDFGFVPAVTVVGTLFYDNDGNGTQDPAETFISGVPVSVIDNLNLNHVVVTDANGDFFADIAPGLFTVTVDSAQVASALGAPGAVLTTGQTFPDQYDTGTLGGENSIKPYGYDDVALGPPPVQTGTVKGYVFFDGNSDGDSFDVEDTYLGNVVVDLIDTANPNFSMQTTSFVGGGAQGIYTFTNVPVGSTYQVVVDPVKTASVYPANPTLTTGAASNPQTLPPVAGGTVWANSIGHNWSPVSGTGSVSGWVFYDGNQNGVGGQNMEPSDVNLVGVVVTLKNLNDPNFVTQTTATLGGGAPGFYKFSNLPAGSGYQIDIDEQATLNAGVFPANYQLTSMNEPQGPFTILDAQNKDAFSIGYYWDQAAGTTGSVDGWVFFDGNSDGDSFDVVDNNLAGVVVDLIDTANPGFSMQVTSQGGGAQGHFQFDNVPVGSTYQIVIDPAKSPLVLPASPTLTTGAASNPQTLPPVVGGQKTSSNSIGYNWNNSAFSGQGSIHGFVFYDNTNDAFDVNLAGVVVNLLDANDQLLATYTTEMSANGGTIGHYHFDNLVAGINYKVVVDTAASSSVLPGVAQLTTANNPQTITNVVGGQISFASNIGYGWDTTVTGHIFNDLNADGDQDAGEPDFKQVSVVITDSQNNTQTVTTDAAGNYTALVYPGVAVPGLVTANIDETNAQLANGTVTTTATGGIDTQTISTPTVGAVNPMKEVGYNIVTPPPTTSCCGGGGGGGGSGTRGGDSSTGGGGGGTPTPGITPPPGSVGGGEAPGSTPDVNPEPGYVGGGDSSPTGELLPATGGNSILPQLLLGFALIALGTKFTRRPKSPSMDMIDLN